MPLQEHPAQIPEMVMHNDINKECLPRPPLTTVLQFLVLDFFTLGLANKSESYNLCVYFTHTMHNLLRMLKSGKCQSMQVGRGPETEV